MGKGLTQEHAFEFILTERGVSEKDIGWVLSKLDSQEFVLDDCHYMGRIICDESETSAKEIFINRYFALNISCLLYTSPSPRDGLLSRMPSSA